MRSTRCGVVAVSAYAMLCAATPASAQSEASIAYHFVRLTVSDAPVNFPVGVSVDYAHPLSKRLRAVAVVDWNRRYDSVSNDPFAIAVTRTQGTIGGGARVEVGTGVYAQAVVGVARTTFRETANGDTVGDIASSDLTFGPSAGVAFPVATRVRIVGEVGLRLIWPSAESDIFFNEKVHDLRTLVGARIRLN